MGRHPPTSRGRGRGPPPDAPARSADRAPAPAAATGRGWCRCDPAEGVAGPPPVRRLEGEQPGAHALGGDPRALGRDDLRGRVRQVSHHLPADRGVGVQQPVDDGHAVKRTASRPQRAAAAGLTGGAYNYMVVSMISMPSAVDADRVFSALADATRRDIVLRALTGAEGVAELAGHYPMSFAAVQKHVAVLERAGLVTKARTGRRKVVRTNVEALRVARSVLDEYEALWRGRIERMTHLMSARGDRPMTVTAVRKDPAALTMTLTAEFDASPERVWQLWADPRQLERWWGPPTYPATFTAHDPRSRQSRRLPHDRTDRGPAARLLGRPRSRSTASARIPLRDGPRRRDAQRRLPAQRGTGDDRADRGRPHPDVDREPLPEYERDGSIPGPGHGRGPDPGGRPDRRDHQGRSPA